MNSKGSRSGIAWDSVKGVYLRSGSLDDEKVAASCGISTAALRRRARREGWDIARELAWTRADIEESKAALEFSRRQAVMAAQRVIELCQQADPDLRTLHYEMKEAEGAIDVHWKTSRLADQLARLQELEAGRRPSNAVAPLPNDARWDRPGRWYSWEEQIHAYRRGKLLQFGQAPGTPGYAPPSAVPLPGCTSCEQGGTSH